jgi:hypothetical protein
VAAGGYPNLYAPFSGFAGFMFSAALHFEVSFNCLFVVVTEMETLWPNEDRIMIIMKGNRFMIQ